MSAESIGLLVRITALLGDLKAARVAEALDGVATLPKALTHLGDALRPNDGAAVRLAKAAETTGDYMRGLAAAAQRAATAHQRLALTQQVLALVELGKIAADDETKRAVPKAQRTR